MYRYNKYILKSTDKINLKSKAICFAYKKKKYIGYIAVSLASVYLTKGINNLGSVVILSHL